MRHGEFEDPRLVTVYDAECPWGPDDDFFLAVVGETPQARVLDLGCGTGRLTLALADAGHRVTGIDPARASLDAARAKPGADRVTWIEGTATDLPDRSFDVAVMTSHVAQFFTTDEEWDAVLADLRRALVPGGRLVFDSRDPADRRWERWNPVDSRRHPRLPDGRTVEAWTEVTEIRGDLVSFTHHYRFPPSPAGDPHHLRHIGVSNEPETPTCRKRSGSPHEDTRLELESSAMLRFRTEAQLRASLHAHGFAVEHVHGGWQREPVGAGDGELLLIARSS
ncbi:Methyltransferase domain-containing protein [Micromonospora pallida]|uniref:Methyltransferase domain-containing protein n=1 Tax=Micromonospora pallida TaxID=145854 RepID=A0A1C6T737_9ACTN|nr:class I SAM-dependent methyltransferase [Micromonospora pallida]SCL37469.1 Methyltransferase domain-containing protein [Micromonospora pallida]